MSDEARIMDLHDKARDAVPTIFGIASSRINASEQDAALLIWRYMEEAEAAGLSAPQAWTTLFSSAMLVLGDAIELAAEAKGVTPRQVLSSMAMIHQLERS